MEKEVEKAVMLEEEMKEEVERVRSDGESDVSDGRVEVGVVRGVEEEFKDKYKLKVETDNGVETGLVFRKRDLKDSDSKIRGLLAQKGISPDEFGELVGERVKLWDGKEVACPDSATHSSRVRFGLFYGAVALGLFHSPSEINKSHDAEELVIISALFILCGFLGLILFGMILSFFLSGYLLTIASVVCSFFGSAAFVVNMGRCRSDKFEQFWTQTFGRLGDFADRVDRIE